MVAEMARMWIQTAIIPVSFGAPVYNRGGTPPPAALFLLQLVVGDIIDMV